MSRRARAEDQLVQRLGALQGELFLAIKECATDSDRELLRFAENAIDRCTSQIAETIRRGIHDDLRDRQRHAALLRAARSSLRLARKMIATARAGAMQAREARARNRDVREENNSQQARLERTRSTHKKD